MRPRRRVHLNGIFMTSVAAAVLLAASAHRVVAQDTESEVPRRVYETRKVEHQAPTIDGMVDDPAWGLVEWSGDFVQHSPDRGAEPSQETALKILYDDDALYVAFRAYDTTPQDITSLTTRRDWFPGDWVEINIDSHFDHRTAYSFTASVSGVRGDEFISQDGDNWDGDWDPIWFFETNIDDEGWTAEIKIPLSQLRFGDLDEHVWGIQATRRVFREEERSTWQPIPQDTPGWVSRFGELRGIRGIKPKRQIELVPYAVTSAERFQKQADNPFATGSDEQIALGVDGKVGLTSDLTVNFTINPDFGQVEADPSEVNLSAFETFFSEKRPFFIEGSNIFEYRIASAVTGGSFTQDRLFYSRRIGRSPRYFPDTDGFVDFPDNTSIIGAAKLSGKTKGGWSIGVLESVTAREEAEIDVLGDRSKQVVEPTTNFFVSRVKKDFDRGQTVLGGMFTAVNRSIEDRELEFLHDGAYSGGIDFLHSMFDRNYYVTGNTAFSHVTGDERAILGDQRSSARYYQRPDADYVEIDTTRTSLSGHAGSLKVGKSGGGITRFQTGLAWRSPGFETNDMGFLRRADEINQFTWFAVQFNQPFSIFRRLAINTNQWTNYDFGGRNTSNSANTNFNTSFRNNYSCGASLTRDFDYVSNTALRGGPSSKWPGSWGFDFWVNSDSRQNLYYGFGAYWGRGDESSFENDSYWVDLTWRPSGQLRLSASPNYSTYDPELQFVRNDSEPNGDPRYVFGALEQETASLTFRLDYAVKPDLTIQYYGQPFISAGTYSRFKKITDPKASAYGSRFEELTESEIDFGSPDFNVRDFNSNLVVRWEFQAGSLLYLVWNQSRSGFVPDGRFSIKDDVDALFDVHPHNIFLIKVSRWFSL